MQGDILFIFYLAKCLEKPIETKIKGFLINPTYADDLTIAGTNQMQVNELEQKMSTQLEKYNLNVNAEKTEKYELPRPPPPGADWPVGLTGWGPKGPLSKGSHGPLLCWKKNTSNG